MKRAIFFIIAIILCSFSSQLLALPEDPIARLGMGDANDVKFSPDGKVLVIASNKGIYLYDLITFAQVYYFITNGVHSAPMALCLPAGGVIQ